MTTSDPTPNSLDLSFERVVPVTPQQVGRQVDASMQQEQRQLERRVETATAEP